jgi:hypothetical protein
MKNCIQCIHHKVVNDRDSDDWFNDDDCAVLCTLTKAEKGDLGPNVGGLWEFKATAVSCRPYQIERDAIIPVWCPLKKKHARRKTTK